MKRSPSTPFPLMWVSNIFLLSFSNLQFFSLPWSVSLVVGDYQFKDWGGQGVPNIV